MKAFRFISVFLLLTVSSCGGTINSNFLDKTSENLNIDVFSLTFHKQMGSCETLPITHRMLTFAPIYLAANGNDRYIGAVDILLDESSKTYRARYREFPNESNVDQTLFETALTGDFEVIKASSNVANDEMILKNLGVVSVTIKNNTIGFILKLDGNTNRVVMEAEVPGRVINSSTPFIDDNCLL